MSESAPVLGALDLDSPCAVQVAKALKEWIRDEESTEIAHAQI